MALFKSAEEKEAIAREKEQQMLKRYGLENLSNKEDIASVQLIIRELAGTGMMEAGMALSLAGKPFEILPVHYLRTIVEQNWIMIRQLDRISKQLSDSGNEENQKPQTKINNIPVDNSAW